MKNLTIYIIYRCYFPFNIGKSQTLQPKITFNEDPLTHNVHITSDGINYIPVMVVLHQKDRSIS